MKITIIAAVLLTFSFSQSGFAQEDEKLVLPITMAIKELKNEIALLRDEIKKLHQKKDPIVIDVQGNLISCNITPVALTPNATAECNNKINKLVSSLCSTVGYSSFNIPTDRRTKQRHNSGKELTIRAPEIIICHN